jgi:hypothetical protein
MVIPSVVGIVLALIVSLYAAATRLDGDRAFYPTLLAAIAGYYVLFAVIGGTLHTTIVESAIAVAFVLVGTIGFRRNLWLVSAALAAHGVFDLAHHSLVSNPGVPPWWPVFCSTYDLTAAAFLAWMLSRRGGSEVPRSSTPSRG